KEIDHVLGAPIELGVPFLAAEALHFRDREPRDADFGQRLAHFIELERLDDGFDLLHDRFSLGCEIIVTWNALKSSNPSPASTRPSGTSLRAPSPSCATSSSRRSSTAAAPPGAAAGCRSSCCCGARERSPGRCPS